LAGADEDVERTGDESVMATGTYSFETVCVDTVRMSVHRDGLPVSLEPKAMDVLLYLLANRDRLVTKDELLDAVWKDTFVTPNVLTRAVAQLRKALGDDAQEARIIGTVSKRGYRFIAPVVEAQPEVARTMERPLPETTTAQAPTPRSSRRVPLIAAAVVAAGALLMAAAWFTRARGPAPVAPEIAATRFTTRQGYDSLPAISPDGRSVVFVSDRTGSLELYLTGLTAGAPDLALTSNGGRNTLPEWSPDGRWIAFRSERHGGIWVVAAAGGAPQQIVEFGSDPSWSADSERLIFVSDGLSSATPSRLWTVRRDGTDRKMLTIAAPIVGVIGMPVWSHNGRFIAFSLNTGSVLRSVWLTSADGQVARKIADGLTGRDIRWTPNDDAIFWGGFTESRLSRLMRLTMDPATGDPSGVPEALMPIDGGRVDGLSLANDGRALFGIARSDANLWQIDLGGDTIGDPVRLTNDAVRTTYPRIAPDGRIAFSQFIEGRPTTTWIMAPDGTGRAPLLPSGSMQAAQWSRDGRRIFVIHDTAPVWVDVETRRSTPVPVRVDAVNGVQLSPDDSGLLHHRSGPDGVINLWRAPLDGGPAQQITFDPEGASYGAYSPDGRWIAAQLTRGADTWIGIMPARPGATMTPLVTAKGQSWVYTWAPDSTRLAFAGERDGVWNIFDVERATGMVRQLTRWTDREGYVRYPAWTPGADRLIFERSTTTSSLWTAKLW